MIIVVTLTVMKTGTAGRGTIITRITIGEIRTIMSLLSQSQTTLRGSLPGTTRHTMMVIVTAIVIMILVIVIIVITNELKAVHFRDDKWNQAKIAGVQTSDFLQQPALLWTKMKFLMKTKYIMATDLK